jgi:hypothetical protein
MQAPGISPVVMCQLRKLTFVGAPPILLCLVFLIMQTGTTAPWIDFLETFAGRHEVTSAQRRRGLAAVAYEIGFDPVDFDFMGNRGFSNCLNLGLQMRDGGLQRSFKIPPRSVR